MPGLHLAQRPAALKTIKNPARSILCEHPTCKVTLLHFLGGIWFVEDITAQLQVNSLYTQEAYILFVSHVGNLQEIGSKQILL